MSKTLTVAKSRLTFEDIMKNADLQREIKTMFYVDNWPKNDIAARLNVHGAALDKYLRADKFRNFDDDRLEDIVTSEDYNPLSVMSSYFQGVAHVTKEMSFTAMLSAEIREKLAEVVATQGVEALSQGDNKALIDQWMRVASKMSEHHKAVQKNMEVYLNLMYDVIDVQKEVSYVRAITEVLRSEDPALFKKIQNALDADPAAKQLIKQLSMHDVIHYWDPETGKIATREKV